MLSLSLCNVALFINFNLFEVIISEKLFKVVGITVHNGNAKVRFTDDMVRRIKQFTKGGASRADFIELPNAMTKVEALKFMLTHPDFASASDKATIQDTLEDRAKDSRKGEVKAKVSKPSVEAIKARAKAKSAPVTDTSATTEPVAE